MNILKRIFGEIKNTLNLSRDIKPKGIASTLELIAVIIALFLSFGIFFPGPTYKNNWEDAYAVLLSRDMLASLVATGDLHPYITDPTESSMENFFDSLFQESNFVFWYEMEGIKEQIDVACACSNDQIQTLTNWANGLEVNGRSISVNFCRADLSVPESKCIEDSDLLFIWNYDSLDQTMLNNYLTKGKGIIDIRDFSSEPDSVHQTIFGISGGGVGSGGEDLIIEPSTTKQLTYQNYKNFYHMPLTLSATEDSDVPDICSVSLKGVFKIRGDAHGFWVCDGSSVYFDSTGMTNPDIGPLTPEDGSDEFTLGGFDFKLAYIDREDKIMITFSSSDYRFEDFSDSGGVGILPADGDDSRIFVRMSGAVTDLQCGVVLNNVSDSRSAWVTDFARGGLSSAEVGDDHRQLILSLIIWASSKQEKSDYPNIQKGYSNSYIRVNNTDMFEIIRYEVGVGYPY